MSLQTSFPWSAVPIVLWAAVLAVFDRPNPFLLREWLRLTCCQTHLLDSGALRFNSAACCSVTIAGYRETSRGLGPAWVWDTMFGFSAMLLLVLLKHSQLTRKESFRIAFRCSTFHPP